MTDVTDTSKEAYSSIYSTLSDKQRIVFDIINCYGPISNQEIAEKLGWKINSVTGRVFELRQMRIVFISGHKESKTGRRVRTWTTHKPRQSYEVE